MKGVRVKVPKRVTRNCVGKKNTHTKRKVEEKAAKKCKENYEITPFGQAYMLTVITMIRWTDCQSRGVGEGRGVLASVLVVAGGMQLARESRLISL